MTRNNKKRKFKLRLSRVIPSFNLCRPKKLPINPAPLFPPPPIPVHGQPAPARRSSSLPRKSLTSAVCGCRGVYVTEPDDFKWMKDDSWLVVAKMPDCDSPPRRKIDSGCDDADGMTLISTPTMKMKMKHLGRRRNDKNHRLRISVSSSADTWETEQLISPSSDQRQSIETKHVNRERQQQRKVHSPPRSSVMRRLVGCRAEGKVRESLAVVKRSVDPYEDFKRSMMEMIMEKELFDAAELQQLLECFLSLNSKHYYATIVGAFSEVWETLFCKN